MNLSGESVSCLLKKENRSAEKLIVIVDDLALPLGTIRIRPKGSDGGHNGLKSITACLKTQDYFRLRIGIKPEHPINDTSRFVLENFSKADLEDDRRSFRTKRKSRQHDHFRQELKKRWQNLTEIFRMPVCENSSQIAN